MTPNELRIGNYLYFNSLCQVISIHSNGMIETKPVKTEQSNEMHPIQEFTPIPLSDEWLLKFGFHSEPNRRPVWETELDYDMLYVHQFQNLYFALTGVELI